MRLALFFVLATLSQTGAFCPSSCWSFASTTRAGIVAPSTFSDKLVAAAASSSHETNSMQDEEAMLLSTQNLVAMDTLEVHDTDKDDTYAVAFRNTVLSIVVSIAFGAALWYWAGPVTGKEFFAGYIVEKSLSVDNLFVFLLLFDFFQIPTQYQTRILSWGIYGSVVMRAIMIGLGAAALERFHAVLLVFAAILIYSAVQVLVDVQEEFFPADEEHHVVKSNNNLANNPVVILSRALCDSQEECDIDDFDEDASSDLANPVVLFSRSLIPSTNNYDGDRFFTVEDGVRKATPLFVCMVAVELSDVVFAVDSIPAVFGVTENPLVVFSSNMFAILGLRSLYPVLSKAATDLKYLEPAVAVILAFIGGKMIAEYLGYPLPTEIALAVIISLLGIGVAASVAENQRRDENEADDVPV